LPRGRRARAPEPLPAIDAAWRRRFQADLLTWFAAAKRDLPWRRSHDPYRIWISEVMLQQTRVEAVIPYYERWLAAFPDAASLAVAPEQAVLKAWEGLGYYSRARNLQRAAREMVAQYGGTFPDDPVAAADLPGVGSYTAGAVLSIAYGRPQPAVDGNVLRVLARLLCLEADIMQPAVRKQHEAVATQLIPAAAPGDFNQALMELGATLCVPRNPRCEACPVAGLCQARAAGRQGELPVRSRAREPRTVNLVAAVAHDPAGRVLIARRPPTGLLAGLWEFPCGELGAGEGWEAGARRLLGERFGLITHVRAHLLDFTHTFSHLRWLGRAFLCQPAPGSRLPPDADGVRWVTAEELDDYPFATAQRALLEALRGEAVQPRFEL